MARRLLDSRLLVPHWPWWGQTTAKKLRNRHPSPATHKRTRTRIRNMTSYTCATVTPKTRISCCRGSRMPLCGMRHVARVVWQRLSSRQCPANSFLTSLSHYARAEAARGQQQQQQRQQPAGRRRTTGISLSAHLHTLYARVWKCACRGVDRGSTDGGLYYILVSLYKFYLVVYLKSVFGQLIIPNSEY